VALNTLAAKGWRAEVVLRGVIADEEMINSPTAGGATTYYSRSFPVVDPATYVVTDDETKVTLEDDGAAVAPGNFTLTGSLGRVVFGAAPANGSVITFSYTYQKQIAYGEAVSINVDGGLESIHVLSQRRPKEILEGIITIKGDLTRYFVNRDIVGKLGIDPDGDAGQPEFTVFLYPLGQVGGKPSFTITQVKFSPWNLSISDPNTPVKETVSWEGLLLTTGLVP
jgi:hypothetical protein